MLPDIIKVPGIVIALNGEDYLFAPLALGPARAFFQRIAAQQAAQDAGQLPTDEQAIDLTVDVAWHSLRRNYEGITKAHIEDLVGIEQSTNIFRAALDVGAVRQQLENQSPGKPARLG